MLRQGARHRTPRACSCQTTRANASPALAAAMQTSSATSSRSATASASVSATSSLSSSPSASITSTQVRPWSVTSDALLRSPASCLLDVSLVWRQFCGPSAAAVARAGGLLTCGSHARSKSHTVALSSADLVPRLQTSTTSATSTISASVTATQVGAATAH